MKPGNISSDKSVSEKGTRTMDQGTTRSTGLCVYSLCDLKVAREKLSGLSLVTCVKTAVTDSKEEAERRRLTAVGLGGEKEPKDETVELNLAISDRMSCSFCNVEFADRDEQVRHYKSDFHRFNLKRRLRGAPPVTEEGFEDIADNMSSSLSGSDSSSDDEESDQDAENPSVIVPAVKDDRTEEAKPSSGRTPVVYFKNADGELLSMYRCVLHGKKNIPETDADLLSLAESSPLNPQWAVLMVAGGHFAAAIFNSDEITEHKTFHRYTVRAKRGTAQGLRDSQGNAPKSAGASLRRYGEASLIQETQDLLQSWSEQLKKCSVIFLRAPSYNRALFFGHKNPPFDKNDTRVRMIPFATRRPTFNEVKRVHGVLSSVINYGLAEEVDLDLIIKSPTRQKRAPAPRKQSQVEAFIKQVTKKSENASAAAAESSDDELDGEVNLFTVKEILTTIDLKMFEMTKKPKRRNKKKKKKDKEEDFGSDGEVDGEYGGIQNGKLVAAILDNGVAAELEHIQNGLYTSARTGNTNSLESSLKDLREYVERTAGDSGEALSDCAAKKSLGDEDARDNSVAENSVLPESTEFRNKVAETPVAGDVESPLHLARTKACKNGAERYLAILNRTFGGNRETLLHVSSRMGKAGVIMSLLEAGADPCVRNGNKLPPYAVAASKENRNVFRRFMGKNPDKYDYALAQIPAPLSEEKEAERKAKESERKKAAKKAKQEQMKNARAKEAEREAEEREKRRYLNLSEREKRALAAEKRLVKQAEEQTGARPVLSRCWHCGTDITGLTPFEYYDYKFCTTKCLRAHRISNQEKKS
ncbi:tRNA endonuclease ANKZF1-like isoform X2 [Lineus longissimus]|uniref:tRNA endonuclease ANKZF1-like isoform X2 n=1 Tax=Lineus longissimus TaxID=88925 RepID=UPI002B4E1079